jgi:uroporphyrinogen-III synthase
MLSTKKLSEHQRGLILNSGFGFVDFDILRIEKLNPDFQDVSENVIVTSKNAISAIETYPIPRKKLKIYCVGEVTSQLLQDAGYQVAHTAEKSLAFGNWIVENKSDQRFTYLTSAQRRNEMPDLLKENGVSFNEVFVYDSQPAHKRFERNFAAVLFYSPNGVYAFAKANPKKTIAICIGETTAQACRGFYDRVIVAKKATVENTIVTAINTLRNEK